MYVVIHRCEGPRVVDVYTVCWVYRYEGPRVVDVHVYTMYRCAGCMIHRYMYEGPRAVDVQCTGVL